MTPKEMRMQNAGSTLEVPVFKEKNRGWLKNIIQTYG